MSHATGIVTSQLDEDWPRKFDLFGLQVSAATYDTAVDAIFKAVAKRTPAITSLHAVHAVICSTDDPALLEKVNSFQMIAPDGQPVRWALNLLHRTGLRDRVYGPELMLRLCAEADERRVPVYLYGSTDEVLDQLSENLSKQFPGLKIAGSEAPPFRPLSTEEDAAAVRRINQSGAGIVFVGLGAPKQDHFAYDHRSGIQAVQVCVGAAFDFHAGAKKMAPRWMQRCGLEWLFRLVQEPRRLWHRYLVTNSVFMVKFVWAFFALHWYRTLGATGTVQDNSECDSLESPRTDSDTFSERAGKAESINVPSLPVPPQVEKALARDATRSSEEKWQ